MSLSTLQAQLAALNSSRPSAAPGLAMASNRHHGDRIGRGMAHSVQQGHSVLNNSSIKHRPTLLYETTTAAADVPLATLQQNGSAALQKFIVWRVYPRTMEQIHSVLFSSTTAPSETTAIASSIRQILTVLSCILGECETPADEDHTYYAPTLHIYEYLLRKYDIHIHYSVELLWSLLPLAKVFPRLMHRCLLLCDWTAVHQSYLWLRPYCTENNDPSAPPPLPPPQLLAISIMKHVDILRFICQTILPTLTKIYFCELDESRFHWDSNNNNSLSVRLGLSRILSFTAALVVDGLVWLRQNHHLQDAMEEAVLRSLLPTVSRFLGRRSHDGRVYPQEVVSWGYVVASTLVECLPVSNEVVDLLCIKIVRGMVREDANGSNAMNDDENEHRRMEASLNAISCLISILFAHGGISATNGGEDRAPSCIPLLQRPQTWLGCYSVSSGIYDAMVQQFGNDPENLPNKLGWLLNDQEFSSAEDNSENIMIVPIASLIAALFGQFVADTKQDRVNKASHVLVSLISNQHLRRIWMDPRLDFVASLVLFLLLEKDCSAGDEQQKFKKILLELHKLNSVAAERGIAAALQRNESITCKTSTHEGSTPESVRIFWKNILEMEGNANVLESMSNSDSLSLPPRIALEHADPSVRLRAVRDLVALSVRDENKQSIDDDNAFLLERLLRQMMYDSNIEVKIAIGSALTKWFERGCSFVAINIESALRIIKLALEAFYHFCNLLPAHESLFNSYLVVLGCIAREVARLGDDDLIFHWQAAVEGLVAIMGMNKNSTTTEAASCALFVAFDHAPLSSSITVSFVKSLLRECGPFIQRLNRTNELRPREMFSLNSKKLEVSLHKKCVLFVLELLLDFWTDTKNIDDSDQRKKCASETLSISLYFIEIVAKSDEVTSNECAMLTTVFSKSWDIIRGDAADQIPAILIQVASTQSEPIWSSISGSVLRTVVTDLKNEHDQRISPFIVIFEAAVRLHLSNGTAFAVKRLIRQARDVLALNDSERSYAPWLAVIPALSLLESKDRAIRVAAADFLRSLELCFEKVVPLEGNDGSTKSYAALMDLCRRIPQAKSSAKLDEQNFLATFLASCVRETSEKAVFREALLSLCFYSALSCSCDFSVKYSKIRSMRWLELQCNIGGCNASATVMEALELAGEDAFPLALRWKSLGSKLFDAMLTRDFEAIPSFDSVTLCYEPLGKSVCRMLKGVTISDPVMIISTGHRSKGQGGIGRTRSYSVGKMEGISVLAPYPDDMIKALIRALLEAGRSEAADVFGSYVIRDILTSATWGECVFRTLSRRNRVDIAIATIEFITNESTDGMDGFPIGAPLCAGDLVEVLKNHNTRNPQFVAIVLDFVRSSVDKLSNDKSTANLLSGLFLVLSSYTGDIVDGKVEDADFVVQHVLIALTKLLQHRSGVSTPVKVNETVLNDWNKILRGLLGCEVPTSSNPILDFRSRFAVVSLLVTLSDPYPNIFIETLMHGVIALVTFCSNDLSLEKRLSITFSKTVPCFLKNALSSRVSLTDFLFSVIPAIGDFDEESKKSVFSALAKALYGCPSTNLIRSNAAVPGGVGALQATIFATDVFRNGSSIDRLHCGASSVESVVGLLVQCSPFEQVTSLLLLLRYVTELTQFHDGLQSDPSKSVNDLLPTPLHIGYLAVKGSWNRQLEDVPLSSVAAALSWVSSRCVIMAMLSTFCDGLALGNVREYIQSGEGDASKLSLLLWQNALFLQALSHVPVSSDSHIGDDAQFREFVSTTASECLESIQELLPLHVFLAAATALIKDGDTVEIQCQALRLLTSRVQRIVQDSSEAALFIDVVPIVLEYNCGAKIHCDLGKDDVILMQSAIYTIEHISRWLALPKSTVVEKNKSFVRGMSYFIDSLQCCLRILVECNSLQCEANNVPDYMLDLISTAALCVATLVRIAEARCLSILPKLMTTLMTFLDMSNSCLLSDALVDDAHAVGRHQTVQLSMLRCLMAIIETVPQFLPPYLTNLLTGSRLLSPAFRAKTKRKSGTIPVAETMERLCAALSTKVATRLLVPAVLQALQKCSQSDEIITLMSILYTSTSDASSSSVVSQKDVLLNAITTTLDFEGAGDDRLRLVNVACNLFVVMILKLSEVQLRRLYESLRDWRGDIVLADPQLNAVRRFGFWTLSAHLSQELRSIFLPCLDLASDDFVTELTIAVNMFQCKGISKASSTSGTKKQKLGKSLDYGVESMRIAVPLLSTLESALRADAHQGGKWIRGDDNRKFENVLEPLGKLLFSRIPVGFPVPENVTDKYQYIVQGVPEHGGGSVIGCLSSLAVAGGNEQLWKPLNHIVVQACGEESRADVRCAGLICLLQLMKSLGEEYMVLLPENLPIISELLEDSNGDVARLAREVVTQAEDLLGESLEESLR
jgi:BP28CT (NUC211) domain